jgi:LPS-assembly protein
MCSASPASTCRCSGIADPSAERGSGFLSPDIKLSKRRGISYEQPYYSVISPSADLTITPQLNTDVERRWWKANCASASTPARSTRFGYTYDKDFDGEGDRFGDRTSRSFILGRGAFAQRQVALGLHRRAHL